MLISAFELQESSWGASNFDKSLTKLEPVLTPVLNDVIRCIKQDEFAGFSFVNNSFDLERRNF